MPTGKNHEQRVGFILWRIHSFSFILRHFLDSSQETQDDRDHVSFFKALGSPNGHHHCFRNSNKTAIKSYFYLEVVAVMVLMWLSTDTTEGKCVGETDKAIWGGTDGLRRPLFAFNCTRWSNKIILFPPSQTSLAPTSLSLLKWCNFSQFKIMIIFQPAFRRTSIFPKSVTWKSWLQCFWNQYFITSLCISIHLDRNATITLNITYSRLAPYPQKTTWIVFISEQRSFVSLSVQGLTQLTFSLLPP